MSKFRQAFAAGRDAIRSKEFGVMQDPVGQDGDQERLRALGKWRFVAIRGVLGWGIPMFLWLALSNLGEDVKSAAASHQSTFQYLFHSWVAAFSINAFLGIVIGILAWRRITSEVWPGAKPDPEAAITRLGPLGPQ